MQSISSSLPWKGAYDADKEKAIIMQHLFYHRPFEKVTLSSLLVQYRSVIANNKLCIIEGHLVFYERVLTTIKRICRIVVPVSLRHNLISLLHASPAAGHMGEYRIIYRIKLQFF